MLLSRKSVKTTSGGGSSEKKKKVVHHGVEITKWVKNIDKTFLCWTLLIGIGEFLVVGWPATAFGVFGGEAIVSFILLFYGIRGILLIYSALSAQGIYIYHGVEGVKDSPLRIFGYFKDSYALSIWWGLAYIIGGLCGLVITIFVAATYTWYSCKLLFWLTFGFYLGTTIESFIIPTLMYKKAVHNNVTYYLKKEKKRKKKKKKPKRQVHDIAALYNV